MDEIIIPALERSHAN